MSDKDLELLISLALSEGCEIETGNIRQHDKILAKRQAQQQVVLDRIAKDKADAERWRKLDRLTDKVCGDIFIHANGKPADWTSPIAEAVTAPSLPVPDTFRAPTWIEMFRYHVNELAELHSKAANQGLTEHRLLTSNLMLYSHGVEINVKGTALQSAQPSQLPAQSAKQK